VPSPVVDERVQVGQGGHNGLLTGIHIAGMRRRSDLYSSEVQQRHLAAPTPGDLLLPDLAQCERREEDPLARTQDDRVDDKAVLVGQASEAMRSFLPGIELSSPGGCS
jgi:hypothetical protein